MVNGAVVIHHHDAGQILLGEHPGRIDHGRVETDHGKGGKQVVGAHRAHPSGSTG
jgi:hypothetical protein